MKTLLLFITLACISLTSFAQQEDEQFMKNKILRANMQIDRLKSGSLLVRLFYKEKVVDLLNKAGKTKAAANYKAEVINENNELIKAFSENFTFCPVYFFHAKYSEEIRNRNFQAVTFIDKNGNEDSDISIDAESYFYTAEISHLRVDTNTSEGEHYPRFDETNTEVPRKVGELTGSIQALRIRSDKFVDLLTPFPYFARTFSDLPLFKRSQKATVKRLNKKLYKYFGLTQQ